MADADRPPLQNQLRLLVLQLDALPDRAERGNRALVATGVGPTGVGSAKRRLRAAVAGTVSPGEIASRMTMLLLKVGCARCERQRAELTLRSEPSPVLPVFWPGYAASQLTRDH